MRASLVEIIPSGLVGGFACPWNYVKDDTVVHSRIEDALGFVDMCQQW